MLTYRDALNLMYSSTYTARAHMANRPFAKLFRHKQPKPSQGTNGLALALGRFHIVCSVLRHYVWQWVGLVYLRFLLSEETMVVKKENRKSLLTLFPFFFFCCVRTTHTHRHSVNLLIPFLFAFYIVQRAKLLLPVMFCREEEEEEGGGKTAQNTICLR